MDMRPGILCLAALSVLACAAPKTPTMTIQQMPAPVTQAAADLRITVESRHHYIVNGQTVELETMTELVQEQDRNRPLSYVLVDGTPSIDDLIYLAGLGKRLGFRILYQNQGLKTLELQ